MSIFAAHGLCVARQQKQRSRSGWMVVRATLHHPLPRIERVWDGQRVIAVPLSSGRSESPSKNMQGRPKQQNKEKRNRRQRDPERNRHRSQKRPARTENEHVFVELDKEREAAAIEVPAMLADDPVVDHDVDNKMKKKLEKKKKTKDEALRKFMGEEVEKRGQQQKQKKTMRSPKKLREAEVASNQHGKVKIAEFMTLKQLGIRSGIPTRELVSKLVQIGGFENASRMDLSTGVRVRAQISAYTIRQLKLEASRNRGAAGNRRRSRVANTEVSEIAEGVTISAEIVELLMLEFGRETERDENRAKDEFRTDPQQAMLEDPSKLKDRDAVVTVMGHVDHGKTSLLDALRNTNIAAGEEGGITQRVGAFNFTLENQNIVFLDTPGHEAFSSMRRCGSMLTDIIVLVVAATDGVRPQTIESIEMAKAAGVPLVVALSKVDVAGIKESEARNRIAAQLTEHGVETEDMGGDVQVVPIAAPRRQGLKELSEAILLLASMLELKADHTSRGEGVVLESTLDKGLGGVADIVTRWGTMKVGDNVVCGEQATKIRKLLHTVSGKPMKEAPPSTPVRLIGFKEPPAPGSDVLVLKDQRRAKEVAQLRKNRRIEIEAEEMRIAEFKVQDERLQEREDAVKAGYKDRAKAYREKLKKEQEAEDVEKEDEEQQRLNAAVKVLPVILKADTDGSLDALRYSTDGLSQQFQQRAEDLGITEECGIKVIRKAVGPVTASDVDLARTFEAKIFAFNVRADQSVMKQAGREGVEIFAQAVIYHLLDDMKKLIDENTPREPEVNILGSAKVLQVFKMRPRNRREGEWFVAGSKVEKGEIKKGQRLRVRRGDEVIFKGGMDSLKHFKDDVNKVSEGQECGISLSAFQDFEHGDIIEAYEDSSD